MFLERAPVRRQFALMPGGAALKSQEISSNLRPLKALADTVADMENFNHLLLFQDSVCRALNTWFGAIFRDRRASVWLFFEAERCFLETSIPRSARSECSALIAWYKTAKSRCARDVRLTSYATLSFEGREKLLSQQLSAVLRIFESLADTFLCVNAGCNVEQVLVSSRILYDGGGLPFDC